MTLQLLIDQATEALRTFRADELEELAIAAEHMREDSLSATKVLGYERFAALINTTKRSLKLVEHLYCTEGRK